MEIENGRFYQKKDYFTDLFRTLTNGFTQKESNEEDIDDIDKIADSYSAKQTASQSKKKAHKKYATNMNARFQDYSANFSCPYPDRSKLTREEKKAMDLQKLFDNMEKVGFLFIFLLILFICAIFPVFINTILDSYINLKP